MIAHSEAEIWHRIIERDEEHFPIDLAQRVIRWDFGPQQHARIEELSVRAAEGSLSEAEERELGAYVHVGDLLSILQSKARITLTDTDDS